MAGPRLVVDPPAFTPSPFGLLTALTPVASGNQHWQNGVTWQSMCLDPMGDSTYDDCLVVTGAGAVPEPPAKTANVTLDLRGATPFTAYAKFSCATVGNNEARQIGERALAISESWQVERALWTGLAGGQPVVFPHLAANAEVVDPNVNGAVLQTAASIVVTGGAVDVATGLGLLEERLANCSNGVGYIHVPVKVLPTLDAHGLVRNTNGFLKTLNGNIVIAGAGYPGTSPSGVAPATGESWIYATGAMFMYRSGVRVTGDVDSLNRSNNTYDMIAERNYVIGWDCCHAAILVDIGVAAA